MINSYSFSIFICLKLPSPCLRNPCFAQQSHAQSDYWFTAEPFGTSSALLLELHLLWRNNSSIACLGKEAVLLTKPQSGHQSLRFDSTTRRDGTVTNAMEKMIATMAHSLVLFDSSANSIQCDTSEDDNPRVYKYNRYWTITKHCTLCDQVTPSDTNGNNSAQRRATASCNPLSSGC